MFRQQHGGSCAHGQVPLAWYDWVDEQYGRQVEDAMDCELLLKTVASAATALPRLSRDSVSDIVLDYQAATVAQEEASVEGIIHRKHAALAAAKGEEASTQHARCAALAGRLGSKHPGASIDACQTSTSIISPSACMR